MSYSGELTQSFDVMSEVKHGCVLAPVIFNIFLSAVTQVAYGAVQPEDCLAVNFRLDGNLFSLQRINARTLIETVNMFDLQYADDAAL